MDTAQWHQEMGGMQVKPMEEPAVSSSSSSSRVMAERRARPQKEQALNCPRCNSTNTKFCYYNNYSLTQPRYFCKACRRYWTQGGSLRNVPVGGGSRKNKRSSSSANPSSFTPSTTTAAVATTTAAPTLSSQNPRFHEGQDLNLAYPEFGDFSRVESGSRGGNPSMEFLRSGISGRGLGPFMQMSMPMSMPDEGAVYPSGFGLQQPTLSFPIDGIGGGGGGGGYGMHEGGGRLLFPFEDLKPVPSSTPEFEQSRGQGGDPPGFWNGMIGGGPW